MMKTKLLTINGRSFELLRRHPVEELTTRENVLALYRKTSTVAQLLLRSMRGEKFTAWEKEGKRFTGLKRVEV